MKLAEMEKIRDHTNHRYIIRMMEPSDWLRHYNEGGEVVNDFILPRGRANRMSFPTRSIMPVPRWATTGTKKALRPLRSQKAAWTAW